MKLNDYLKDKSFHSAEIQNLSSGSFSLPGGRNIKPGESKTLEELGLSKEIFDKFCRENHLENLTDSPKAKLKIKGIKQSLVMPEKEVALKESVENLLGELATDEKEKNISNALNPEIKEEDESTVIVNVKSESGEDLGSVAVNKVEVQPEVVTMEITRSVPEKTEVAATKKRTSKTKEEVKTQVDPEVVVEEKVEV